MTRKLRATHPPQKAKAPWLRLTLGSASWRLQRRALPVGGVLLFLLLAVMVVSVGYGDYWISPVNVFKATLGIDTGNGDHALVVRLFRWPRILVAALVGAALALSGAILQGITRNPLADPGILGINSGAALAAVLLLTFLQGAPLEVLPLAALAGGLGAAALIYLLAWRGGSSALRLILVGIGVAAVSSALVNLMLVFGDVRDVQQALVWLAGSVYGKSWEHVGIMLMCCLLLMPPCFVLARSLNALALGDSNAAGLGVRLEPTRLMLTLLSVALAATAVSVAGTIGFVGLVAPHIARRLVGPHHEGLIPTALLCGALLVVAADLVGRSVLAPTQLPAGLITALIGGPYFIWLLARTRSL